jgi:tetratricopeptide (TPR) repeat protein
MIKITTHFFFALIFCFCHFNSFGQNKKVDSLLTILKTAKDTNYANVLYQITNEYRGKDQKRALQYAGQSISAAEKIQFINGLFNGNTAKGLVFYETSVLDSALYYFLKAEEYAKIDSNMGQLSSIDSDIGNAYGDMGQNKKSIQYYLLASDYAEKSNKKLTHAFIEVNIATVYSGMGQHDSALVFYLDAEKIISGIDTNQEKLPIVYNNIGASYLELHDSSKAEAVFEKALRISLLHNDQRGIASGYDHVSVVLFSKGNRDSAVVLAKKSIFTYQSIDSKSGLSEVCVHLGAFYFEEKEYDSALVILNKGLKIATEIKDDYNLKTYYEFISKVYEGKGQFALALDYHKKLLVMKDTLFNRNSSNIVNEMKTQLTNEKVQRENELLNVSAQKKNVIIYFAISLSVLILLLALLAFNRYLVKRRSHQLLTKQNDEIQIQKNIIQEKNKDITDSINYAKRIQHAMLPDYKEIEKVFPNSFVLFQPKDIVSGDFYFFHKNLSSSAKNDDHLIFIAAVDCTGHGVPGAFMSMVGAERLTDAVQESSKAGEILTSLNKGIRTSLKQSDDENSTRDGMDIALCSVDTKQIVHCGLSIRIKMKLQKLKEQKKPLVA